MSDIVSLEPELSTPDKNWVSAPAAHYAVVGEGLRAPLKSVQTLSRGRRPRWTQAGVTSVLSLLLVLGIASVVISVLGLLKKPYDEHRTVPRSVPPLSVTVSPGTSLNNSFFVKNHLKVGGNINVTEQVKVDGDLEVDDTLVCTNLKAGQQGLTLGGVEWTPQILKQLSNFHRSVSVGISGNASYLYTVSNLQPNGVAPITSLDVFKADQPWVVLGGDASLMLDKPVVNTDQGTIAFVKLPPGYWIVAFQCSVTNNIEERFHQVVCWLVSYTENLENVVKNGAAASDSAALFTDVNPEISEFYHFSRALEIPASSGYQKTKAVYPMVEFTFENQFNKTNTFTLTIQNITMTCIQLA